MSEIAEAAINFEAVKTSMSQSKAGTILRIAIHPNDVPPSLHTDWVGSRYMVAMVKLDDEDKPEISDEQREKSNLVASAAMLCRNYEFGQFMYEQEILGIPPSDDEDTREDQATRALRFFLNVSSRSELKTDDIAANKFRMLQEEFLSWKKKRP
mgnify:FL=1|tara:strand:- start:116 stop:577 length:462 start_codon:yes stop_codon:yes gene_type:complete